MDMSGKSGRVQVGHCCTDCLETPSTIARCDSLSLAKRLDPDLTNAPMFGANAMSDLGAYVGIALLAMNCQFTEAVDLLTYPKRWSQRLREAARQILKPSQP